MVIKILYYFLCFFFIVIFMLVSQDPYSLDLGLDDKNKPTVEFFNVKDYSIGKNGVELEAKANRAQRFEDMDVLYDLDALVSRDNKTKSLKSNNATIKDEIVYLRGNVKYADNSSVFTTEAAEYYQKESKLIGTAFFTMKDKGFKVSGDSFVYDIKMGKLEALNTKTVIMIGDR